MKITSLCSLQNHLSVIQIFHFVPLPHFTCKTWQYNDILNKQNVAIEAQICLCTIGGIFLLVFLLLVARTELPWWLLLLFPPIILERWHQPMNEILSVCWCSLSSQYTNWWWRHSNFNCYNQICLNYLD